MTDSEQNDFVAFVKDIHSLFSMRAQNDAIALPANHAIRLTNMRYLKRAEELLTRIQAYSSDRWRNVNTERLTIEQ